MSHETKSRILDAAEHLYAERGVAATSLRAIMKEARANTAAIHYHFGSRTGLIHALLARRAEPVNRRREEMLADLERRHPDGRVPVDELVRAFFVPVLEQRGNRDFRHATAWIGRMVLEGLEPEVLWRVFGPTFARFVSALRRSLPELTAEQAERRMRLMIGTMVFAMHTPNVPVHRPRSDDEFADVFEDLVAFTSAGLSAPALAPLRKEKT